MDEAGLLDRLARGAVRHPLLVLALLTLVQVLPTLASRDYWAFDEVRHADALRGLLDEGHWLSLRLDGAPYPDKPPVYFWLAAGAARLLGTDGPPAFFLVAGLGGFLFLWATWGLARATVAGADAASALLAPLLVSVTPLFQLLLRTTRMDLLFGALITASLLLLWRGVGPVGSRRATVLGLGVAGLATLVKGPAGLALPLAALVLHLVWTGRARRLLGADVLLGGLVALLPILAWALGVAHVEGWDYLRDEVLGGQVAGRAVGDHKHAEPFFHYLLLLPVAFLPWTFLLAAVPWRSVLRPASWRALVGARREQAASGRTWLACAVLGPLVVLSLASTKLFIYLMPLLAPLAALAAPRVRALVGDAGRRVWTALGISLLVAAAALPALEPLLRRALGDGVPAIRGDVAVAVVLGATGLLVLALRRRPPGLPLAVTLGGLLAAHLGLALFVAPSLDPIMSPRAQAERLAAYVEQGARPLVFRGYAGTYSYYAGRPLPGTSDVGQLRAHVEAEGAVVVAMRRKYWERHAALLGSLEVVHEQLIEGRPFVLAVRRGGMGKEPK